MKVHWFVYAAAIGAMFSLAALRDPQRAHMGSWSYDENGRALPLVFNGVAYNQAAVDEITGRSHRACKMLDLYELADTMFRGEPLPYHLEPRAKEILAACHEALVTAGTLPGP